ncbi:ribonuclease P 40kDa subunit-domain-containing protein [Earliella scabrosa]|nr:ribonuclease P 40kDa subunit-domain-containing protein [Earliella scabrosa]
MAAPESKRTIITTSPWIGSSAAADDSESKLRALAPSRPFTQQIDVVFPTESGGSASLRDALQALKSSGTTTQANTGSSGSSVPEDRYAYRTCEYTLSEFVQFAKANANSERCLVALGMPTPSADGQDLEDVWSLDPRGVLTLAVGKQTYETLGLVGERLPWKECQETHVIRIGLWSARPEPEGDWMKGCATYGTKEDAAVRAWDARRGPWKVFFHLEAADGSDTNLPPNCVSHPLEATVHTWPHAHIPVLKREDLRTPNDDASSDIDIEDWHDRVSSLFEWVGMAALGSQRLSAADRCDPYIAVYTPPEPSRVGELTTMRWRGLIPPSFVQALLDVVLSPNLPLPAPAFVSVTAQSVPTSPVTYVPTSRPAPLRAPRADAEDTWSFVYVRADEDAAIPEGGGGGRWWVLAESVGKWDRRWG